MTASDTRFCNQCLKVKPITEFRRRSRTGSARLGQCRACHNESERQRLANKRAHRNHRRMAKCLTELKNERSNDRLELILGVMITKFGGMQGFITAWDKYCSLAMEQSGFAAFRCFSTVIRLAQYCEEHRSDPSEMTDEELERAMMEHTEHLIQQHPELAVAAARRLGWQVEPVGE